MEAACRGAKDAGGTTLGILPGTDRAAANPFVDVAVATGLGEARNALVVRAADAVIAIGLDAVATRAAVDDVAAAADRVDDVVAAAGVDEVVAEASVDLVVAGDLDPAGAVPAVAARVDGQDRAAAVLRR
jgi:uncharacterized protein (TIGR00725 family)